MPTINDAAQDFLAQKRIAVVGVSRHPAGHGANPVYRRLRERGYEVFASIPMPTSSRETPATTICGRFRAESMRS